MVVLIAAASVAAGCGGGAVAPTSIATAGLTTTTFVVTLTLLTTQGSGSQSTGSFKVGSTAAQWSVGWAYNCSNHNNHGQFEFAVLRGTDLDLNDPFAQHIGASGSGAEHYHDTGTFRLDVTSQCKWAIRVTEVNG